MTNKAGEQSPAHFLPYLNPLLNPFSVFTGLGEKAKTRYPLRDNGFQWSCYPDLNRRPHPYQVFSVSFLLLCFFVLFSAYPLQL